MTPKELAAQLASFTPAQLRGLDAALCQSQGGATWLMRLVIRDFLGLPKRHGCSAFDV